MLVAIVGVGEVGRCYAEALHKAGFELLPTFEEALQWLLADGGARG